MSKDKTYNKLFWVSLILGILSITLSYINNHISMIILIGAFMLVAIIVRFIHWLKT